MQKDAYTLILEAIDDGVYRPGDRLVESELADRFGVSRTPVREALQRLETQSMLARDGRSLIVASLDHNQLAELYVVRAELEGLAARLAAKHATTEEVRVLHDMIEDDRAFLNDPDAMSRANRSGGARRRLSSMRPSCEPLPRVTAMRRRRRCDPTSQRPSRRGSSSTLVLPAVRAICDFGAGLNLRGNLANRRDRKVPCERTGPWSDRPSGPASAPCDELAAALANFTPVPAAISLSNVSIMPCLVLSQ